VWQQARPVPLACLPLSTQGVFFVDLGGLARDRAPVPPSSVSNAKPPFSSILPSPSTTSLPRVRGFFWPTMFANRLTELDLTAAKDTPAMSLSPDSSFSAPAPDVLSHVASSSSTPPTTVADSASLHSDASKHDVITVAVDVESVDVVMADAEPVVPDLTPKLERDATPVALAMATPVTDAALAPVPSPNSTIMVEATTIITEATPAPVASEPAPNSTETTPSRVRRARGQAPVYNLAKLSGTDGHGKRRSKGDIVSNRRRRTVGTTSESVIVKEEKDAGRRPGRAARTTIDALNLPSPAKASESPRARRQIHESPRSQRTVRGAASSQPASASLSDIRSLTSKMPDAPKRGRKEPMINGKTKLPRELRNLRDTKEFAHVDEQPIIYTVWANGKYVDPSEAAPPARKRVKVQPKEDVEEKEDSEPIINTKKRLVKKYLDKGLYSGQDAPIDISKGLTMAEKKKLAQLPELIPSGRVNSVMPAPLYTGLRTLIAGRDFKLPFQVCNPLPPGQPKPDEWKKMTKSMFLPVVYQASSGIANAL
jgi:[histone H3]-lysine4 N-trimethyltransferase ASH1L